MEHRQIRPAVNFNLITVPNEWGKRPDTTPPSPVSERNERYRDFFQSLVDTLREEHRFTNARKAQPNNWYSFSAGHGRVKYGANFAMGGRARIELYIDSFDEDWIERLFDHLLAHQTDIESELAASLDWERLEDRKASRIAVVRPGSIDDDDDTLKEIQDWMVERLLKFKEVFGPKLTDFAD